MTSELRDDFTGCAEHKAGRDCPIHGPAAMRERDESYIRMWGREPETVLAEKFPPERCHWRDKSDAQLTEMVKRIGAELNHRGNARYERTGNAREARSDA